MWTSEEVVTNAALFFSRLEAEIDGANRTVDLETYIFKFDEVGMRVLAALDRAVTRGVRVRLLVDGFGTPFLSETRNYLRVFRKLPWGANKRNHRKTCIVDGKTAWVGSINVTADHLTWNDCVARVEGPGVLDLAWAFERAWQNFSLRRRYRGARPELSGDVRLNDTFVLRQRANADRIRRIRAACARVWVISAYFVPNRRVVRALIAAARYGKDVRVLVPRHSDVFFIRWLTRAYYYALLRKGVRVFEYQPRVLHAKIMMVDDCIWVGSANINHRSIIHDLESEVLLQSSTSRFAITQKFERDFSDSKEIFVADLKTRPLLERLVARLILLLRYWI